MKQENLNILIREALAIEAEEAKKAGALGYMARALVQATMPHSKTEGNEFTRTNGHCTFSILAPSKIGLPYGSLPRLLMSWITTEAVLTKSHVILLGHTLGGFMAELGLSSTGGKRGYIGHLKRQMTSLFSSTISCIYEEGNRTSIKNVQTIEESELWWEPKKPDQATLWESTLTLNKSFFDEIINNPVPIDMRALKALKRSPMALDIYCWLTYRMSYLDKPTNPIPWQVLQFQFGASYASTPQGVRDFKRAFLRELKKVAVIYYQAKIEASSIGLILKPSQPHIPLLTG